ncbi:MULTISPECIES: helix-turn-helix transcriptional regulator [unclassified Streptomyces]|uniref:helix-turn-helix domain-containing protein n=1 Tax=unclassified Streptomyces TaxID=2593676 RepID=UPI002DD884A4|nr:helix-turn-helix transcriptional regulator [Streptomyces sp. NBC_01750]WSB02284.1 helix-turn-helix domain-containing protein [Streptomyces sp. NBC_01794]WSD33465.1 helix-turn-helix domain-containing protein [Streptomyces sp. NBC_01750]
MPMPDRVFDGGKLRDRRVIKRLSQATLAEGLHVKVNAVYRWENGLAAPPPERLSAIAAFLDADLNELFPRTESPNLADLRCDAGMTQADTARYTNTSSPMPVRAAEQGKRPLSDQAVTALAAAYNVTRAELLAAQRRSFGQPEEPEEEPSADGARVARKLESLRSEVYGGAAPSDAHLASEGNRKSGSTVLTEAMVRALRAGEVAEPEDEALDALALAFDVPPVYFRQDDPEVDALILSTRAVRNRFTVMVARRAGQDMPKESWDQLRDFIGETMAEILADDENGRSA